jgi:glycerophosphoryl diester phosphodiesterase
LGVRIIGHRGASGVAPENTLAAFRRALEMGAAYIETDLQLSKDGSLVLLHDPKLERTTNGRGLVASQTLAELQRLDAGGWFRKRGVTERFGGERIMTVEEILQFAREHDIGLYLEMKTPARVGAEQAVVSAVRAAAASDRVCVISFDLTVLAEVRALDPRMPLGYLFSKSQRDAVARAISVGASTLLPRCDRVTAKLIAEAKDNRLHLVTWTVNDPRQMKTLIAMGVGGIMTDYPDRLVAVVQAGKPQETRAVI